MYYNVYDHSLDYYFKGLLVE